MSKREVKLYIEDIKESIEKIDRYTKGMTFEALIEDEKTIDAVVRNLAIIGEAVVNTPEEIKEKYPDMPWYEIKGMRNRVVHEYFGTNNKILWDTIKEDIPKLKEQVEKIVL